MTRLASPRFRIYAILAVVGVVGGIATGRPEIVAVGAPFLVLIAIGVLRTFDVDPEVTLRLDRTRALEGETVTLLVGISSMPALGMVEIDLDLAAGVIVDIDQDEVESVNESAFVLHHGGGSVEVGVTLRCDHWGVYRPRWVEVRIRQGLTQFVEVGRFETDLELRIYPPTEVLRTLLHPMETQLGFGDLVSRQSGDGLEFAEVRPMASGDDPRKINWRVTARGRGVWVNDRHPERNADVVILVDTLAEARRGVPVVLDLVVRAAAAIAAAHLHRHDRVGLIMFGEPVRWLQPGMGDVQRYRILDTLMESRIRRQLLWRGVRVVPPGALPAGALVVGLTPLLDDRAIDAFAELRGRGFDLAIVEIPAEMFVLPAEGPVEEVARRIWALQRTATQTRFRRHGVPVVRWNPADPFEHVIGEVETYRRGLLRARA